MKLWRWGWIAAGIFLLIIGIPAVSAYLTSQGELVNSLNASELKIGVREPAWTELRDSDQNGIPDLADGILFHASLPKDPILIHEKGADAYGYMEVTVPRRKVRMVSEDHKTVSPLLETDLYSFQINPGWILIEEKIKETEHLYVYGYRKAILREGQRTEPLFESVQIADILEGTVKEGEVQEIKVRGIAVQSENLESAGGMEEQILEAYRLYCGQRGGEQDEA